MIVWGVLLSRKGNHDSLLCMLPGKPRPVLSGEGSMKMESIVKLLKVALLSRWGFRCTYMQGRGYEPTSTDPPPPRAPYNFHWEGCFFSREFSWKLSLFPIWLFSFFAEDRSAPPPGWFAVRIEKLMKAWCGGGFPPHTDASGENHIYGSWRKISAKRYFSSVRCLNNQPQLFCFYKKKKFPDVISIIPVFLYPKFFPSWAPPGCFFLLHY